jgi:hypothetical protein
MPDKEEGGSSNVGPERVQTIHLTSEDVVWETIKRLHQSELDPESIRLDFSSANWAEFRMIFRGEQFDQSLTPSAMQGLVDFQNAFYRCIALVLRDSKKITSLTDAERDAFELVFVVREGSSDLVTDGKEKLQDFAGKAFEKMTGRQIMICILLIAVLYFGNNGLNAYLSHAAEIKRIEKQEQTERGLREIIKDLTQNERERVSLLEDIKRKNEEARTISDESDEAYESIIRHSTRADSVVIQGRPVSRRAISEITSISRRRAKNVVEDGIFTILSVDTSDPKSFVIRLKEERTDRVISALLEDAVVTERYKRVIREAEWGKTRIKVKLSGRKIGSELRNARILKASKLRN